MLRQATTAISVRAPLAGLHEFSREVAAWVERQVIGTGLLTVFCRHTSASLLIQENAAPAARRDLERYFAGVAPESAEYEHDDEGPDDMPAHVRTILTQSALTVPITEGQLGLGTWQGIYLWEHRTGTYRRRLTVTTYGGF